MYSASAAAALYSTSDLFLMDQVFGEQCHATADYPDHRTPPQMSPPVDDQPFAFRDPIPIFGSDHMFSSSSAVSEDSALLMVVAEAPRRGSEDEISSAAIRARIASHPLYPKLLESYIDCQKVGAPPEIGNLLDEISKENNLRDRSSVSSCLGTDPELDQFMENYCDVLVKYKSDLAKPFEEATSFLNDIETQLGDLCSGASRNSVSDEAVESSGDDCSGEESQVQECCGKSEGRKLKDKLLLRYSGYIGSLKHEFSKKKKKGKLPKEARQILLDWWTVHYKWPYPTEVDKVALAESTGLDQKQINNWFINQRKRHWKPSESMQFAVMDSLYEPFIVNDQ